MKNISIVMVDKSLLVQCTCTYVGLQNNVCIACVLMARNVHIHYISYIIHTALRL